MHDVWLSFSSFKAEAEALKHLFVVHHIVIEDVECIPDLLRQVT